EEAAYLEDNKHLSVAALAQALSRSEGAIKIKAGKMGLSIGRGTSPAWSDADMLKLCAFAGFGERCIAGLTGRTISAVRFRAATNEISLKRNRNMIEACEESAAIMEHDGGWPRVAAELMAASCQYMFARETFHVVAPDYLREHCPDHVDLFDHENPLDTQVKLAECAFAAVGTIDDLRKIDHELAGRFEQQARLWQRSENDEERAEHAGGMTRGYLAMIERLMP
ncbi:MAG: hypothetical protein ACR2QF_02585, partial [Geminicoccaceae bacterium]